MLEANVGAWDERRALSKVFQDAPVSPPMQLLQISNRSGGPYHYYHFLLGVLCPLCIHILELGPPPRPRMLFHSCGPMDRLLKELAIPELIICPRDEHAEACATASKPEGIDHVVRTGFDFFPSYATFPGHSDYDSEDVRRGAAAVERLLHERVATDIQALAEWGPSRVVVIERGPSNPFYATQPRGRTSGTKRRSIANHADLVAALSERFPGLKNVHLEDMPLTQQIALFRTADVVVAQHGAALANTIWMKRGTNVIEIAAEKNQPRNYFGKLATIFGVHHQFVLQEHNHSPVSVSDVLERVTRAMAEPGAHSLQ